MSCFTSFWRNLLARDRVERDRDDELQATFELLVAEKLRGGVTPDAARRAARLELGATESLKDQVRDARRGAFLDTLLQDVRYGARLLRRNPLFALTAALSVAIGIGATTAIFTVGNGVLLRSAEGVPDHETLVDVVRLESEEGPGLSPISYLDYQQVRRRTRTLEHVFASQLMLNPASLELAGTTERILRQGMMLMAIGSAVGFALSLGVGRVLMTRGFGRGLDVTTLVNALLLFAAVALIACYVPVRRALRLQGMDALRYE